MQLDGAYGVVNATCDPVQEPLGQLESLSFSHALIQVCWVAEFKLASILSTERQLAKCATLIEVLALSAMMADRLDRRSVPILRLTHRSQTFVLYIGCGVVTHAVLMSIVC